MTTRPAATPKQPARIAVIGAGVAGAACAAALRRSGFDVVVFDKSRGVGGRLATRRVPYTDADGAEQVASVDHGAPHFSATRPRFQAALARAEMRGSVTRWNEQVHAAFPAAGPRLRYVPVPNMPSLCRHLLTGVSLRLGEAVTRLHRRGGTWQLMLAGGDTAGPFDQVLLAIPAPQAALLLLGHHDDWADALAAVRMAPCWTLMAVTDEVDWPWDAAEPERGPFARIARDDRKPGRRAAPGRAHWVAHATAAWSTAHLEDDPASVSRTLQAALQKLLPGGVPPHWFHVGVHRWRHATLVRAAAPRGVEFWWNAGFGLGVCGDSFGNGSVQAAWCSGDELADTVAAALDTDVDTECADAGVPEPVH